MDEAVRYLAEIRIAAAVADGVFEDLPGRGAPLKLEDYAAAR